MVRLTRHKTKRTTVPKAHTQSLMDMPLDVLIEVFLFTQPLDLLHLARTTKALREFLLDRRKTSTLWKSVIGNVEGFPPCPDHMSPPEYTHLAFVPECHGCFGPCETIEWELRMRCCQTCFPQMTISQYDAFRNRYSSYRDRLLLPRAMRYILKDDLGFKITVAFENIPPPVFSALDWNTAKRRTRPRGVSMDEFLAEQNNFWESIRRYAQLCQDWERGLLLQKAAQLSSVRRQRVEDIRGKLKELGWADVVSSENHDGNYSFSQLPEVRKIEPLTASEWDDICPQLITWAQNVKAEMVWRNCGTALGSVFQSMQEKFGNDPSLQVRPRHADVVRLPVVRSTLERAVSSNMNREDLETKLRRILPSAIRKWSLAVVEELEQLVQNQLHLPPLSKLPLHWVIFRCKTCPRGSHSKLRFDSALSHYHNYERVSIGEKTSEMSDYDKFMMTGFTVGYGAIVHLRNVDNLRVDVTASGRVENLVKRMGQSPSRTTYDALRRSTLKVVCSLCPPKAEKMNFEDAFQHCLGAHPGKKETEVWSRVSTRE